MRKIDEIIVHCTATPRGRETTVADIDLWHRARGWKGIGYHWVVYLDGSIHAGRPEEKQGAHCSGHNGRSIGVVYVGGIEKDGRASDTRTEAQKAALIRLLRELKERYPGAKIHGHREFAAKACPCFDAKKEYEGL
ncbi:MAG: N-acetylmuramoyl-L-alanine amidase [Paramuribaculum sp.]|nr:N-acetylmuramoyl-L-alanine amidase [Paramuribaculum sp.]